MIMIINHSISMENGSGRGGMKACLGSISSHLVPSHPTHAGTSLSLQRSKYIYIHTHTHLGYEDIPMQVSIAHNDYNRMTGPDCAAG